MSYDPLATGRDCVGNCAQSDASAQRRRHDACGVRERDAGLYALVLVNDCSRSHRRTSSRSYRTGDWLAVPSFTKRGPFPLSRQIANVFGLMPSSAAVCSLSSSSDRLMVLVTSGTPARNLLGRFVGQAVVTSTRGTPSGRVSGASGNLTPAPHRLLFLELPSRERAQQRRPSIKRCMYVYASRHTSSKRQMCRKCDRYFLIALGFRMRSFGLGFVAVSLSASGTRLPSSSRSSRSKALTSFARTTSACHFRS